MSVYMSVCFAHSLVCLLFILLIRFCLGYCRLSPFFKPTPVTSSITSQAQSSLWLSSLNASILIPVSVPRLCRPQHIRIVSNLSSSLSLLSMYVSSDLPRPPPSSVSTHHL